MTENDPKRLSNPRVECCLRCGQPLHDHNLFDQGQCPEPQPAPREGLTAEQRATDFIRRTLAYCNEKLSDEAVAYLASEVSTALAEIDALKSHVAELADIKNALRAENERLQDDIRGARQEYLRMLSGAKSERDSLRALVAERGRELAAAQTFARALYYQGYAGNLVYFEEDFAAKWKAALAKGEK